MNHPLYARLLACEIKLLQSQLDADQRRLDQHAEMHRAAKARTDVTRALLAEALAAQQGRDLWPDTLTAKTPTTPKLPPTCDRADTASLTSPTSGTVLPTCL